MDYPNSKPHTIHDVRKMWCGHPVGVNVSRYYGGRPEVEQKTASATLRVFHLVVLELILQEPFPNCLLLFIRLFPSHLVYNVVDGQK